MSIRKRRSRIAGFITATILAAMAATPASADCVTAGASVTVAGSQKTILADGTCVAPTPFPLFTTREVSTTGYVGARVVVGVPFPDVRARSANLSGAKPAAQ